MLTGVKNIFCCTAADRKKFQMPSGLRKFSIFYFFYYAALGAYTPYIGRWVDSLGHSGYVVGAMLGIWYGTRIVGPPLWNAWLQKRAQPGIWFVAGSVATLICFAGFTLTRSAFALLAVMTCFGLFYNAVMPQFEAMTLTALGTRSADYGRTRVWGSVGFLVVASSYGWLLDRIGNAAFPWMVLPLFVAMAVAAWPHRNDRRPDHFDTLDDAEHLWKRPGVRRFLLVALLMQMSFGAFYVFYTLYMQASGHSGSTIGVLWGTGVLIEIIMFWHAPKLIERFGSQSLLAFCLGITVLRWVVTALFAVNLPIMFAAQVLHAFSFAVFFACCMREISRFFPGRRAASGQSLFYGFSSGIGGVIGAGLAAVMWERGGGRATFLAGAAVAAVAWVVYSLRERSVPVR
jgi:PPP family 3-phenylpropionic acid transporter